MPPPAHARSAAAHSLDISLAQLGVLALLAGALEIALVWTGTSGPGWVLALFTITGWVYVAAGLEAWRRRPSNRLGAIMMAGGVAWLVAGLANTGSRVLVAVGLILATVPLAVVVHLLHAFPSGRVRGRPSRITVVAGYAVSVVLQAPLYLFATAPAPYDVLVLAERPDLVELGVWIQSSAGAGVVLATVVLLVHRLRAADSGQRRVLGPLYAYGIVAVLFVPVSANVVAPLLGLDPVAIAVGQLTVLAAVPVAFALGVLRGGFARTGEVEELGAWLGAERGARPALAEALAETLGDPSLELAFWTSGNGTAAGPGYVDASGRPVTLPQSGSARGAVEIDLGRRRVGAIAYDAGLIAEPELVRRAGRVVALALDRDRLTAELLASREALQHSRARIVAAGDRERRRIARDLHDGVQARLVLLGIEAARFAADVDVAPALRGRALDLQSGLTAAATELRGLVHGVLPAVLIERGLYAATEDLVDRLPIPTDLDLRGADGALPAACESTAYFVVAEALTNAVKHSRARELSVRLTRGDDQLSIEVRDDGVGGATEGDGTGLRGLADRLDALGGRLRVESPVGRGTRLVAELPCAS